MEAGLAGRGVSRPRRHAGRGPLLSEDMLLPSSCAAEFIGTALLALLAGSTSSPARIAGLFAALMAAFAPHSGGHLFPTLSLAAALSGHMPFLTAGYYIAAQFLGALSGSALLVWLSPGLSFGEPFAPACHAPLEGLGGTGLYIWELLAAFVFVYVMYPAALTRPGYGAVAPLVMGVALFGTLATAGAFTGHSPLNPALTFAGCVVFNCSWRWSWIYLLAQATGAGLAALLAAGVFGVGPNLLPEEERAAEWQPLSGGAAAGVLERSGLGGGDVAPAGAAFG